MNYRFYYALLISLTTAFIAWAFTYISSLYIYKKFNNPPIVNDLLWSVLPYHPSYIILTELIIFASVITFLVYSIRKNRMLIPYAIILISVFHIIRAGMIILTPLGFPNDYCGLIPAGEESVFAFGAFPSGHLSIPYIFFMIFPTFTMLIMTILTGYTLLVSRGHYSIDLIGTLMLAYLVVKFGENYLLKYFHEKDKHINANKRR